MEISELRRLSARTELSLNYIAKDEMISKALFDLQNNEDIILKGGTAINRIYLKKINKMRFSEDIDFDIVSKKTVKKTIKKTDEILKKVKGFKIARPRIMKETIRYDLFYANPLGNKDKISVEFKVIKKITKNKFNKQVVNFGFVPFDSALLNVYTKEELLKQKFDCLKNRMEGKDIYDFFYLLDHVKIRLNRKEIEEILSRLPFDLKEIRRIANIANHYIPRNLRPDWITFLKQLKEKLNKLVS